MRSDQTAPTTTRRLTAALRRWAEHRAARRHPSPATRAAAGARRALPLHEALAIGLGCDLGSVDRHTARTRAQERR